MSDDLITRLRDLSVTLGRFRSDDEVDEALHDAAARIAALEAENAKLRAAARAVIDAEEEFISHMHPDWEKDPVAEAVDDLRAVMDAQP